MNKTVHENYPASKLPADLRDGHAPDALVTVVVEPPLKPLSREEFLRSLADARNRAKGVTIEEAVARIRELRDEWDD